MRFAPMFAVAVLAAGSLLAAGSAISQDAKEGEGAPKAPPAFKGADPRDHDPAEMQARWMETMIPNRFHERLGNRIGTWDVEMTMWMAPGAPPSKAKGVSTVSWVFPGRWVREETDIPMMGQPWKGFGLTGYDNYKKKYVSTWIDSMTTAMIVTSGNLAKDGATLVMYGAIDEPMTGEHDKAIKVVWREPSADVHQFELHDLSIGETETLVMKMDYVRRK